MERGLDTGPMLAATRLDINYNDTTETLTERLAESAADLMIESLAPLREGSLIDQPQGSNASLTRPLTKADGWLDWDRPVVELEHHVRAMWSWPRAWTTIPNGHALQVHRSHVVEIVGGDVPVGTIVECGNELAVQAHGGLLVVDLGQLPNGKPQPGSVLTQRAELQPGQCLGQFGRPLPSGPMIIQVGH
jgi:methionyl-tRNA formyltransferase